jgi:site-specific DNA-methyltransferase (adenine-specific)
MSRSELRLGDAIEQMGSLAAESVDAVVTDPPYGLGLRGAAWDTPSLDIPSGARSAMEAFEEWTTAWADECLRLLKPGGYLVAFGAPRTVHRLAAGIEDAGFELRDQLLWLYGGGVPKTALRNGRSSQLKPAYEPIVLARKPPHGDLDANETRYATGRLGIDDTRIPRSDTPAGRWPANVTLSHTSDCGKRTCSRTCPVRLLDRQRPDVQPSRFFYCAKASRAERDAGCETLPSRRMRIYGNRNTRPRRNTHLTVKPIALMRWLTRLTCPPGGLVLDPFAGSGSTGIAALQERRRFLGIEREPSYARIARARIAHAAAELDGLTVDATNPVVSAAQSSEPLERRTEP